MAALIRLFFSDLIASLQDREPGPDEPWPVMIMLDEFNRLGKMPIVAESIEVLRHYRGHLAVVTQTIPAIDEIYGENTRRALQGNAGVKLYLTPSDEKTVEQLSKAVGKTTKTVVTKSRSIGKNPFEGRSQSTRTEETSLLPEDEARRLPLDEIVVVVDAQMPIRAKRIQYFDDPFFKRIHAAQVGEMPFPVGPEGTLNTGAPTEEGLIAPSPSGARSLSDAVDAGIRPRPSVLANRNADRQSVPPASRATVIADDQRQIEMDFVVQTSLEIESPTDEDVAQVELALGDLDQLEGEVSRVKDAERGAGESVGVR
jgi:type IV secretion system protein VirD4